AGVLRKHFGARELTPDWFTARLFSPHEPAFQFAKTLLPPIPTYQKLGAGFFVALIEKGDEGDPGPAERRNKFAPPEVTRFRLSALDHEFLKRLLGRPLTQAQAIAWIGEDRLKAQTLGADFFKMLAYHPAWDVDPWVAALKQSGRPWARHLEFDE